MGRSVCFRRDLATMLDRTRQEEQVSCLPYFDGRASSPYIGKTARSYNSGVSRNGLLCSRHLSDMCPPRVQVITATSVHKATQGV